MAITRSPLCSTALLAQLNGQNIEGDAGLESGSQAPPPGAYFVVSGYLYNAGKVKDGRCYTNGLCTSRPRGSTLTWLASAGAPSLEKET